MRKKRLKYVLLVMVSLTMSCDKNSHPDPEPDPIVQKKFDFSNLTASNHPRLLMNNDDFKNLKSKIASRSSVGLNAVHDLIMEICDEDIMADNSKITYELDSSGKMLDVSRRALERIFIASYAYRLTGESKYLNKVETDINTVCAFPNWNAKNQWLDAGEMATAVAFGYDWLYNDLSATTKANAIKALKEFAFQPAMITSPIPRFYQVTSNWNQVCNSGLVCAALAIYEHTDVDSKKIIYKAIETNAPVMEHMYSPDGNYPEGPGYWGYGTGFQVLMIAAMEKALGYDGGLSQVPGFKESAEYMLFSVGIKNRSFNYSDCVATAHPSVAMYWFSNKYNNTNLLYNEMRFVNQKSYKTSAHKRLLPMVMAFAGNINMENVSKPTKKIWSGNGETPVLMVHTDWSMEDSDKYLGIKGGRANANHAHMDAGSFIYSADNQHWSVDLGLQDYTALEKALKDKGGNLWEYTQSSMRWDVFRYKADSHSTITINGANHLVDGKAHITSTIDSNNELGGTVDMSAAVSDQASSVVRTIKIVDNKELVIIDQIKALASKDAKVRWNMVTRATATITNNGINLSSGGKTIKLTTNAPNVDIIFKEWSTNHGLKPYDLANPGTTIVGFEATVPTGQLVTFTTKLFPQ